MICSLENVIRSDRKPIRDTAREQNFVQKYKAFIAEHVPDFNPSLIDSVEYEKMLLWIARYRMYQIYLRREDEGVEYEEYCDRYKEMRRAVRKPTPEENPRCDPPDKGLLFVGKTGRGKTTCARLVGALFNLPFATMDQIDIAWSRNPDECERDFFDFFSSSKPVVLDDVGAESGQKRYGNESIVTSFLHRLYDSWRFNGKQIIMTSNLSTWGGAPENQATFLGKYGERIHSRILEMFEVIKINGSVDLRKE